jgi:hypothetical protein
MALRAGERSGNPGRGVWLGPGDQPSLVSAAAGQITEARLAGWVRDHLAKLT